VCSRPSAPIRRAPKVCAATEIGAAVVDHAFSVLGHRELVGFTRPDNLGSRRVLEKLGFVFERTFFTDDEESVLYRLRSEA
jgi:RimJ/RimL family protein N-acetyltransferase